MPQARDDAFVAGCVALDLEVGLRDGRIHHLAAVRGDDGRAFIHRGGAGLAAALERLDAFCAGARRLAGHNLQAFDAPQLQALEPGLRLLGLPRVDTLQLNPLAFPRHPYHRLVKHYQDGALVRSTRNDPELDSRLCLQLLGEQRRALRTAAPELLSAWHGLLAASPRDTGLAQCLGELRGGAAPDAQAFARAVTACASDRACAAAVRELARGPDAASTTAGPPADGHGSDAGTSGRIAPIDPWPAAYALAWLSVAGGNSVLPPWVLHQHPGTRALISRLRNRPCHDAGCRWCRERHDSGAELRRWFRLDAFRPEPRGADGRPLQQAIVEATQCGEPVLGILPTGTGKSVCYQLPALSRYDRTGALTVVISPLVALMADQVQGMEARGIGCAAALNGLLSLPERADVLERVRLGDIGILLVSPEQLRGRALRSVLAQRDIGAWVLDEAHCLSKWGQDFRPDYRYVGRYIRERSGPVLDDCPVLCLTATAKPDVIDDIAGYFERQLGLRLTVLDGGSTRDNLAFEVVPTKPELRFAHTLSVLRADLPPEQPGGAIVYCASRRGTEQLAQFLREHDLAAGHFHAGLSPEAKKTTQQRFLAGELRVIVATNAFGMGIDKPDVRLVVHADVPGSLENYLQEAGRAGRDRQAARCVLLYAPGDAERQFGLSARSRLTRREIHAVLRALRRLDRRKRGEGEIVATPGEILLEEEEGEFERDNATDDTRVRTAIAWLEEAALLTREENVVSVFPSSLQVASLDEARARLATAEVDEDRRRQLLVLVRELLMADADRGLSTDELMLATRLDGRGVQRALADLEQLGVARNDTALTAFVHAGVERSSTRRLAEAQALELALIDAMREHDPDLGQGGTSVLQLRHASQRLKDAGHPNALPETLWRLLRSLAADGRGEEGSRASLDLRRLDAESVRVVLQRKWADLKRTAGMRHAAAQRLLEHLLARLPDGARGVDLLARTTVGGLAGAMRGDLVLMGSVRHPERLLEHALLWLHEQEVLRLNRGLAVFRPAMTIRLGAERRGFTKPDYEPLRLHYDELVLQIHVMAAYAERGLAAIGEAIRMAADYFSLSRAAFLGQWLPGREKELGRQTTPASWRAIVESLANPVQQQLVADEREQTNLLVLAGPGSGKTRVLVHRIAYLLRVRRERPQGILALAYNRHAALQIRQRLRALVGDDANGVTVLTCHALAMRLAGISLAERAEAGEAVFDEALQQAVALLEGSGLAPDEADEQRERLLAGFRWILVDEYQDVAEGQYRLIAALAGRRRADEAGRLALFAVGDDDQNIYAFNGASVEFIRRFEADYGAKPAYLVENYRSTAHIIDAANRVIAPARERMKAAHPIVVDRARRGGPEGGAWQARDLLARGRVVRLPVAPDAAAQAVRAVQELLRLAALDPGWDWSRCAVIARGWRWLEPVRACCEALGVPAQLADEPTPPLWRLRETQALLRWLRAPPAGPGLDASGLDAWLAERLGGDGAVAAGDGAAAAGIWWRALREAVDDYRLEHPDAGLPPAHLVEWLVDWAREWRRRPRGLTLLSAHRAKGVEFDHVVVLDGGWGPRRDGSGVRVGTRPRPPAGEEALEDADAERRLYYVAMTRARCTLALARLGPVGPSGPFGEALAGAASTWSRREDEVVSLEVDTRRLNRRYRRLGLADVYLGYPGRHAASHPLHARLAALRPGDALTLQRDAAGRWQLLDRRGETVGRMAQAFSLDEGWHCLRASVAAVVEWRREDSPPEWQDGIACERWEVVLADLELVPMAQS